MIEEINFLDAVASLYPSGGYSIRGMDYSGLQWHRTDVPKPTEQEIEDEIVRLQAEYEAKEYQRLRQYPSLGDQLDMLWHAIDNGTLNKTSDFYTAIKAVKDAHPKE
jgi:hypothetical protein